MASNGTHSHVTQDPEKGERIGDHDQINGGATLGRQVSINLTPEQYERLFFQPGGPAKGDASKRYGNPTLLGVIGFILCLTPTSMMLMSFRGANPTSLTSIIGTFYFIGGLAMTLAAVGEFILGNTFPSTVFTTFGGFWLSIAVLNDPMHNVVGAFSSTGGSSSRDFNSGVALYMVVWACLCFMYFIAGLRTNVVFEVIFFTLIFAFSFLGAGYWKIGYATGAGDTVIALRLFKAAGAFGFVTSMAGWYLAFVLAAASTGVPLPLPVGDLSGFLQRGNK